jgi:hypothetical protein
MVMKENWCCMFCPSDNWIKNVAKRKLLSGVDVLSSGTKLVLWLKEYGQKILSVIIAITSFFTLRRAATGST